MKLALVGHGKVGKVIDEVSGHRGVEVVDRFTSKHPLRSAHDLGAGVTLIDFSVPDAVLDTLHAAAELSTDVVIGTTGWYDQVDEARQIAEGAGIGVVWAANFSIGTNVFYQVVERAAELFAAFEGYDPFIQDWHHRFKKDSPSGTALELQRRISPHYGNRDLPITSLRAGYVPSIHSVGFDSMADSVLLEHRARNRQGFAEGALLAAQWLAGGRRGFYEFRQVLDDIHPGN